MHYESFWTFTGIYQELGIIWPTKYNRRLHQVLLRKDGLPYFGHQMNLD